MYPAQMYSFHPSFAHPMYPASTDSSPSIASSANSPFGECSGYKMNFVVAPFEPLGLGSMMDADVEMVDCGTTVDELMEDSKPLAMHLHSSFSSSSSFSTLDGRKHKNVRKTESLQCAVCGDRPTGYHYDVLSCNGCKTFYRRTIIAGRSFTCTKGGNCAFTKDFRCACRACRFDKCVAVGMNPKGIQWPQSSPNPPAVRQIKQEPQSGSDDDESVDEMQNPGSRSSTCVSVRKSTSPPFSLVMSPAFKDSAYYRTVVDLMARERAVNDIRDRCTMFSTEKLSDILRLPNILGSSRREDRFLSFDQASTDNMYHENPIKYWMVSDLHLISEYAKSFDVFRQLDLRDQLALLSHVGGLLLLLGQNFYTIQKKHGSTIFPDGTVAMDKVDDDSCTTVLKRKNTPWISELYSQPVELLRELRLNDSQFAVLRAITLFSPMDDDLSDEGRALIASEREKIIDACSRLLFNEEGASAPTKLTHLLGTLQTLHTLSERRRSQFVLFNLVNDINFTPIGMEVYLRQWKDRRAES